MSSVQLLFALFKQFTLDIDKKLNLRLELFVAWQPSQSLNNNRELLVNEKISVLQNKIHVMSADTVHSKIVRKTST